MRTSMHLRVRLDQTNSQVHRGSHGRSLGSQGKISKFEGDIPKMQPKFGELEIFPCEPFVWMFRTLKCIEVRMGGHWAHRERFQVCRIWVAFSGCHPRTLKSFPVSPVTPHANLDALAQLSGALPWQCSQLAQVYVARPVTLQMAMSWLEAFPR